MRASLAAVIIACLSLTPAAEAQTPSPPAKVALPMVAAAALAIAWLGMRRRAELSALA